MCFKKKKLVLLTECILKYYDMAGNILLYQTLANGTYPIWIYIIAWSAIISSFARLMLRFRRLDIKSISYLTFPMIPCELCLCDRIQNEENKIVYYPAWRRILCCGFWFSFIWLWYAILIYPFVTLSVIVSAIYYDVNNIEFNKLLLLYKNHNLIAFVIEDIPILTVLIKIYTIDKQDLFVLIWVCISTIFKFISILRRLYIRKLLFNIDELNEQILFEYEQTNSNSSSNCHELIELECQIDHDNQIDIIL